MIDINKIIKYENGEMNEHEVIQFFQELINTGEAWTLQGHYGRIATALIRAGMCQRKSQHNRTNELEVTL